MGEGRNGPRDMSCGYGGADDEHRLHRISGSCEQSNDQAHLSGIPLGMTERLRVNHRILPVLRRRAPVANAFDCRNFSLAI